MPRIYIKNLSNSISKEELWKLLAKYGAVKNLDINPRGIAIVEMLTEEDADKVKSNLNNTYFKDSLLYIESGNNVAPSSNKLKPYRKPI